MRFISGFSFRRIIVASLIITSLQIMFAVNAGAYWRINSKNQAEQKVETTVKRTEQQNPKNNFLKRFLSGKASVFRQVPGYNREDDPTFSIISFVAGLVGLACVGLIAISVSPGIFVAIGLVAAILAIVFGARGMRSQMKGLAMAGLVLGIAEIVAGLVIVAWVLVVLSQF